MDDADFLVFLNCSVSHRMTNRDGIEASKMVSADVDQNATTQSSAHVCVSAMVLAERPEIVQANPLQLRFPWMRLSIVSTHERLQH